MSSSHSASPNLGASGRETFKVSPDAPLTSFTLFLQLPTELRLKIWRYTLPGLRHLYMKYGKTQGNLFSPYPQPISLHVCTESLAVALKYYERAFGSGSNLSEVYFDFSRDGLLILPTSSGQVSYNEVEEAMRHDLERVKFISCFALEFPRQGPSLPFFSDLRTFKGLKEITVLVRPALEGGHDKTFVEPSSIRLDSWCSPSALAYLELDKEEILKTWANIDIEDFTPPNIRIMSYIGGDFRRS